MVFSESQKWELSEPDIDLDAIFIARDELLHKFRDFLSRWKQQMSIASDRQSYETPSPSNKIQSLVVLLYGHGGFGKSTLLKYFHTIALEEQYHLHVSTIIDWGFVHKADDLRPFPLLNEEIDSLRFLSVLVSKVYFSINKRLYDFKQYKITLRKVEAIKLKAKRIVYDLQKEEGYTALRWLTEEITLNLMKWLSSLGALSRLGEREVEEKIVAYVGKGVDIKKIHLLQLYEHLQQKLQENLNDYLNPAQQLAIALGNDLRSFARNFPLLIFFDTYERIEKGDMLQRIIMSAAGPRVGWIIAGRGNIWSNEEPIIYSTRIEYGYRDIVLPDRLLPIGFHEGDVDTFTKIDIITYFAQLCKQKPSLPIIQPEDAENIFRVTQGIPLAIRITADLYARKPNLDIILEGIEGVQEIVHHMVQLYLIHAPDDEYEREKLYGLALLRGTNDADVVIKVLALKLRRGVTYEEILGQLHHHYSFIFTKQGQPSLHQEVRYFLRLWLLNHKIAPNSTRVITRLVAAQRERLNRLEQRHPYRNLRDRMEDSAWVEVSQDLTEAYFWADPARAVSHSIAFMLAATLHRREALHEIIEIGIFFEHTIPYPYLDWWHWASRGLLPSIDHDTINDLIQGLEQLNNQLERVTTLSSLSIYQEELEATLWWRLGAIYKNTDEQKALFWYRQALNRLEDHPQLRADMAHTYWMIAASLYEEKQYGQCIQALDEAIKVKSDYADAYYSYGNSLYALEQYSRAVIYYYYVLLIDDQYISAYINLGSTYHACKRYQEALIELKKACSLDTHNALIHYNLGNAHEALKEFREALEDFSQAIFLKVDFAEAYMNRGNVYGLLGEYILARNDYNQAAIINQEDIHIKWMEMWVNFSKAQLDFDSTAIKRLDALIQLDPQHYIAHICQAIILALQREKFNVVMKEINQACNQEPEEWDPYFWKGIIAAYYKQTETAKKAIEQAMLLDLPPLLLVPLYWLETVVPIFFREYAEPLLRSYNV